MKKSWLIKLHLYCGLFTIFYLIAFGFSSLVLNHNIKLEKTDITEEWKSMVQVNRLLSDKELAESVSTQLDLMGWLPHWKFERDSARFKYQVTHIGRNYHLDVDLETGKVLVGEAPKGLLAVVHGLHFFNGNIPNGPHFLRTWVVYQWLTLFTMLVSLLLGLWLWLKYTYKPWEGWVFGGLLVLTLLIMLNI